MTYDHVPGSPEDIGMHVRTYLTKSKYPVRFMRLWMGLLNIELVLDINGERKQLIIPTAQVVGPAWWSRLKKRLLEFIKEELDGA